MCGELLGAEEHWITEHPDGEHTKCRDWSALPYPNSKILAKLRRRRRALKAALDEVDACGRWMRAAERRWPSGAVDHQLELGGRLDRVKSALGKCDGPLR